MTGLATPRLELRPVRPLDHDPLHRLWTAPGVRRYLWDDGIIPPGRTAEVIAASERLFRERGLGLWVAHPHGGDELVGFGGFWPFRAPPELELLYGVRESSWGAGYATEIGAALVAFGFDTLGFHRIRASTDAPNTASVRVLLKLGFRQWKRAPVAGRETLFYEVRRPPPLPASVRRSD